MLLVVTAINIIDLYYFNFIIYVVLFTWKYLPIPLNVILIVICCRLDASTNMASEEKVFWKGHRGGYLDILTFDFI